MSAQVRLWRWSELGEEAEKLNEVEWPSLRRKVLYFAGIDSAFSNEQKLRPQRRGVAESAKGAQPQDLGGALGKPHDGDEAVHVFRQSGDKPTTFKHGSRQQLIMRLRLTREYSKPHRQMACMTCWSRALQSRGMEREENRTNSTCYFAEALIYVTKESSATENSSTNLLWDIQTHRKHDIESIVIQAAQRTTATGPLVIVVEAWRKST